MISGEKVKHGGLWTVLFSLVSLAWVFPIVLVIINSFKQKAYISRNAFSIPTGKAFVGLENYTRGIETTDFFASFGWTLLITVGSVILILVCTSMCAWWIVRVNNWAAKLLYTLFLFNMIVPFQMVMFTLSKLADMLKLNTPWGLCIVYLGFGAGLAVFIFMCMMHCAALTTPLRSGSVPMSVRKSCSALRMIPSTAPIWIPNMTLTWRLWCWAPRARA